MCLHIYSLINFVDKYYDDTVTSDYTFCRSEKKLECAEYLLNQGHYHKFPTYNIYNTSITNITNIKINQYLKCSKCKLSPGKRLNRFQLLK